MLIRVYLSLTSKSVLEATIAFVLAGCENRTSETVKPAATAPKKLPSTVHENPPISKRGVNLAETQPHVF